MDFSFTEIDSLISTLGVSGTAVTGGNVRSGDFTLPGAKGVVPGVGVGQAIPLRLKTNLTQFTNPSTAGDTNKYIIPANSTFKVPLSTFVTTLDSQNIPFGTFIDQAGAKFYRFKSACKLFIWPNFDGSATFPIPIKANFSFRDYYQQKGTIIETELAEYPTASGRYVTPRCIYDLYSITLENTSNENIPIIIGVYPSFELPFYNLGTNANIMNINLSWSVPNEDVSEGIGIINFVGYTTTAPDSDITWGFPIINPSSTIDSAVTANAGTVRPILEIVNYISQIMLNPDHDPFLIYANNFWLTCVQNVYGYGSALPNYFAASNEPSGPDLDQPEVSAYQNFSKTIIGPDQYSIGWTDWQG